MKKEVIVYTDGSFDLFHIGHINILRKSKALGTKLIVGVNTDKLHKSYKSEFPIIPFKQRVQMLKACKYVDKIVPQHKLSSIANLKKHKINIVTVGSDWKNKHVEGLEFAKKNGIKVIYFPYTKGVTTSEIIKKIIDNIYKIVVSHERRKYSKHK
jgi:rfaE bifunctional protein nucleotidyltransferase chain/domain